MRYELLYFKSQSNSGERMSEAKTEDEIIDELKQALIRNDLDKAQKIVMQNPGLLPANQQAVLMTELERAKMEMWSATFGQAKYRAELQVIAQKLG